MKPFARLISALLFASLTACGGSAADVTDQATSLVPAASPPRETHMVVVPAGTVLTLALDTALSSGTAHVGDGFTATVVDPILSENRVVIPEGSRIEGKVTEADAAKRGAGNARLTLGFNMLRLPSGYRTGIVGSFQEVTESKKGRNAGIIGGSAAGGALLGRILGKDTKGAVIGSIIGGGIGTAVVMGKEGMQATLAADTPFEIRLEESIRLPHEKSSS
jgi:hypothetical protein